MCLIVFAYQSHPEYKLILAANRDEFYDRPTELADFWDDTPDILAGRDLKAGGTWMGITRSGRFAALTNYRQVGNDNFGAPSRGMLVKEYLTEPVDPHKYLTHVNSQKIAYDGFNFVAGGHGGLFYYSNQTGEIQQVSPGMYGLSNHLLNTSWPKVSKAKQGLSRLLRTPGPFDVETLFGIMADQSCPEDDQLPDTGVGLEWERLLSPIFITSEIYGTRSTSLILWKTNDQVLFMERTFDPVGSENSATTVAYEFEVEG